MIALTNVTKQYRNVPVLKNITLNMDMLGIYCLLGRNGAGKTTLLKSIAGFQNITNGQIQVDGKTITTSTLDTGVSYLENFAKHFNLPVRKLLRIASEVNPNYDFEFASEMMERFELDGKKKFHHLSLGMKTMVSTIICLVIPKVGLSRIPEKRPGIMQVSARIFGITFLPFPAIPSHTSSACR